MIVWFPFQRWVVAEWCQLQKQRSHKTTKARKSRIRCNWPAWHLQPACRAKPQEGARPFSIGRAHVQILTCHLSCHQRKERERNNVSGLYRHPHHLYWALSWHAFKLVWCHYTCPNVCDYIYVSMHVGKRLMLGSNSGHIAYQASALPSP